MKPFQRSPRLASYGHFTATDVLVAYCMVRHFQPRRIIEVGSGFSSLVLGQAAAKNKSSALICIDPFPHELIRKSNISLPCNR